MRTSMHAGTFQSLSGNTIYLLGEPSRSVYRHTSVFEMASKFEGKVQEPSVKPMVGTGNERKGSISAYPQEVKQCCTDVLAWMDEKGPISLKDVAGCDSELLGVIADKYVNEMGGGKGLPQALSLLLENKDGGIPLYEYTMVATKKILNVLENSNPPESMLPIAMDVDGEYLVLGGDGELYTWDPDDGELGPSIAQSFASHLEQFRDLLLSNKYEWIDDCGLVEISTSPKRSQQKK
eukprot:g2291.t1